MPIRPFAAAAMLVLAGCSTSPAATTPPGGSTTPPASAPAASPGGSSAVIDLSGLDVCTIVAAGTAEALTGETGFTTQQRADVRSSSCFWAVPKPGVPQYLEVKVDRRTAPLGDYTLTVNGAACQGAAVPGIGSEARGGVCTGEQSKVWLIAMDRGVAVQVIVNAPKGSLTPADLAATVNAVVAGLG